MDVSSSTPPGRPSLLRSINHRRLLQAVRDHGPISRTALTERLALSRVTVSTIARRLLDLGLVCEAGRSRSGAVGRRAALLDLDPSLGSVLAIDVQLDRLHAQSGDLRGTVLDRWDVAAPAALPGLVACVAESVARVDGAGSASSPATAGGVRHLVVTVPGSVDPDGTVRYAGSPRWLEGAPLGRALTEALPHTPFTVMNDVNAAAVGEHRMGAARGWERYAFVGVRKGGIGMGLVIGDQLYRGAHGRAGEIGPVRLHGEGALDAAMARIDADALTELARLLAVTFAVLDLDGVVVHSELDRGDDWFGELDEQLGRRVPYPVRLVMSRLGEQAVLAGALLAGLDRSWPIIERLSEDADLPEGHDWHS